MKNFTYNNELYHYGVKGMKWKKHKFKTKNEEEEEQPNESGSYESTLYSMRVHKNPQDVVNEKRIGPTFNDVKRPIHNAMGEGSLKGASESLKKNGSKGALKGAHGTAQNGAAKGSAKGAGFVRTAESDRYGRIKTHEARETINRVIDRWGKKTSDTRHQLVPAPKKKKARKKI